MSLKTKVYIWLLNRGWAKCQPWEDPRRKPWEREQWRQAEPKSLRKTG